jgi:hypothetical protein
MGFVYKYIFFLDGSPLMNIITSPFFFFFFFFTLAYRLKLETAFFYSTSSLECADFIPFKVTVILLSYAYAPILLIFIIQT